MQINVEKAKLSNLCGGALERRFDRLLADAVDVFMCADDYQDAKGTLTCKVKLEVVLTHNVDTGGIELSVGGELTRPKAIRHAEMALMQGGTILITPEDAGLPSQVALDDVAGHPATQLRKVRG